MAKLTSSLFRLVFLGFLLFFLYFHESLKITFDYPFHGFKDNIYIRVAKISLLLLLLIELLRVFYYGIIKNDRAPKLLSNVGTLIMPLVVLLTLLEIAFMFIEQSQEGGLSRASHIWFERHWTPMTGIYRDTEHTDTLGKKKVLVIGDSFTAGHGLKNVEDRYSNILASKLGTTKYVIYNLGISGSDTRDEYERFEKFGVKPDVLVLQYFPNDIEKAAKSHGVEATGLQPYEDLSSLLRHIVRQSYLFNYIYWQLPHGDAAPFMDYTRRVYSNSAIINDHLNDLGKFVAIRDKYQIPMYVVLFPFSHNLEKTAQYTEPIAHFFQQHNVPVLEVGTLVKDIDPNDRIVGRNDFHASAVVNHRVGDALYKMVSQNKSQAIN